MSHTSMSQFGTIASSQVGAAATGKTAHAARSLTSGKPLPGDKLRETFDQFVGETFYQQLISSMRKTVPQNDYFHGGRAETAFQGQFDVLLAENLAKASSGSFTDALFQSFATQIGRSEHQSQPTDSIRQIGFENESQNHAK